MAQMCDYEWSHIWQVSFDYRGQFFFDMNEYSVQIFLHNFRTRILA